ncbi:MAG: hypothetical protein V3S30_01115 [Thermoanaerobaculia bacterium]
MRSRISHCVRVYALVFILGGVLVAGGSAQGLKSPQPAAVAIDESGEPAAPSSGAVDLVEPPGIFDRDIVFQAHKLRGLRAEVVSLLISEDRGGPIALAVFATPFPKPNGDSEVLLFVEVDGNSFLQNNQREIARVEFYAYVFSEGGSVVAFMAEAIQIDVGTYGEAIWQSGLKFYGQLGLEPGSYTIRIMVRNYHSQAYGVRSIEIEVPAVESIESSRLTALFEEPTQRDLWLPIRQWSAPGEPTLQYSIGGNALSPSAYPVMVASSQEHAFIFGLEELPTGPTGKIQILVSRDSGEIVAQAEFVAEIEETLGQGERGAVRVRFTIPDLPTAEYAARFAVMGPTGEIAYSTPQPIFILAENPQARKLLWPDLRWLARGSSAAQDEPSEKRTVSSDVAKKPKSKRRIHKFKEDYRVALGKLASASDMEGRSAVFEMESETMRLGFGRALESLQIAEIEVGEELAENSKESLVPIIVLHGGLYQAYRGRRLYALLSHTRNVIERMCEVYIRAGGSKSLAAESLASLGGYLQQASLFSSSQRLFLAALEYESENVTALLGMAAGLERHARYAEAISYLTRLVGVRKNSAEGALRLAINFGRSGASSEAKRLLTQANSLSAQSWVRSLAYQESARIHLTVGDLSGAAEILEKAIVQIPEEQSTYLLLAHVYDRLKEPGRSAQLLSGLKGQPGSHSTSARKIYDSWPEAPMQRARQRLSLEARDRLGALLEALSG